MPVFSSRLALGTVQFGLPYGIANRTGQVGHEAATTIVGHAAAAGIDTLDTAVAYGDCEARLGSIGVRSWQVVTKLPPVPEDCSDTARWVGDAVAGSLARLAIDRLHGLLLHSAPQLTRPRGAELYAALTDLKRSGKVECVGVSIYSPSELDALPAEFHLDMVQAPFNIIDRRLATSGWLARLRAQGTQVHVRSVFLQGLLLMDSDRRPQKFARWDDLWRRWERWLCAEHLTPLQACLSFPASYPEIDRIIVGVDSPRHLDEILEAAAVQRPRAPAEISSEDPQLVDPSTWTLQ